MAPFRNLNHADPSPPIVLGNYHSSALITTRLKVIFSLSFSFFIIFFKVIPYHVWSSAYGLYIPTNTLPSSKANQLPSLTKLGK
ncbi:Uncharacterized protein APZ42_012406 [Daphnia magna]|uniref:Uncharacterized protein n=1 Tax=Daphnia magna TaxID=35525 RepID=A0A162RS45_9CRUS|nr:Uncharacterized protein APZ42_012406 [Daphnia magna]